MTTYDVSDILRKKFQIKNKNIKEFLAEFLGTFILILFGNASVAQSVLTDGVASDFFSINWGYGLAVMFGVTVSCGVSGGHINPAVTLAMAVWGRLSWYKVPFYVVAQYLGSFVASIVLFYEYSDALAVYDANRTLATAGIFATYPASIKGQEFLTMGNGLFDQILATALLLIVICAVTDKKNLNIPSWIVPLFVSFAVLNIGISFGYCTGYAINPARDLSPRFFTLIAGWGDATFSASTVDGIAWWWVPIVGPHIGAILGVLIYSVLVEMHHEDESESTTLVEKIDENCPEFEGGKGVWLVSAGTLDKQPISPKEKFTQVN